MKVTETQRKSLIDALIAESLSYNINVGYYSTKYDRTQVLCKDADRTVFTFKKHCREFEYVVDWNHGIRDERSLIRYIIDKALAYFGYARGSAKAIFKEIPTHLEVDLSKHIEKVIFNPPATIVFWKDKTKTVVKADGEDYDPEKGMAMAFSRKLLGDKGSYYNVFERWLKEFDKKVTVFKKVLLTKEDVIAPWKGVDLPKLELDLTKLKEFTSTINKPIPDIQHAMYDMLKEGEEEARKHDLVQKAYELLIQTRDNLDECYHIPIIDAVDLDTVIGYLGEYLDD